MIMQYVISYDIVGLVLLVLLYLLNYSITKAPTRQTRLYRLFIFCAFVAAFLDVFTVWTNHYTNTPFLLFINNVLAVIHIGFVGSTPLVYYLFILAITYEQKKIPVSKIRFASILFGYDLLTIVTSPFTHLIMYYNEAGEYCHGPIFISTYIVILAFVIAGVFELTISLKKITKKQYFIMLSYTMTAIISAIYQFINPSVLLLGFASAVSLMVVSFSLKHPMELVDNNTGVFNRTAFKEFLFTTYSKGVICIIHIKNAEVIRYMHGLDNGYNIIRKCITLLMKECHQKLGFYIFTDTFVFICKKPEEVNEINKILKKYKDTPLIVKSDEDDEDDYPILIDSDVFLINDAKLLQKGTENSSKKNPLDQVIDILQFLVESQTDVSDVKIIGEEFIAYYQDKVRIQQLVDDAIKNETFEVFLQPIFDLKTKTYTGAESLIRLRDPDGKMVSPGLFIPETEKNGKILELGDISIKKTCEFIRDGHLKELGIEKVNINLSMVQCMQDNIVEHIISLLDQYETPKNMIRFEITESFTATNPEKLKYVMTSLSECGIEFALDDYGTGYSNTSRLLEFPFSEIKFDKSFVDSAMENTRNQLPLKHLMNMVSDSNMIVLVEGVETEEMSKMIDEFGGNLIQGFYYAKPLPLNDFVEFIKSKQ